MLELMASIMVECKWEEDRAESTAAFVVAVAVAVAAAAAAAAAAAVAEALLLADSMAPLCLASLISASTAMATTSESRSFAMRR